MGYEPRAIAPTPIDEARAGAFRYDAGSTRAPQIAVWDLGVRLFHWLLAGAVTGALATGFFAPKPWLDLHIACGTAVAALVAFRVVWGFVGSTHACFADFVVGPSAVLGYLRTLLAGRAGRHRGHNPVGAVMILALLFMLGLLTTTGLVAWGGELKEGPFAPFTSFASGEAARAIHRALALVLPGLIMLHLAGVVGESLRVRENLPRSMLTGRKAAAGPRHVGATERGRPRLAAAMLALIAGGLAPWIVHASRRPGLGVPAPGIEPIYAKECAACHSPHHPSVAPAATWRAIIAGLDDHFGENASLAGAQAARLLAYLTANSAEHWDTKAANHFRTPDTVEPLRITATSAWKQFHKGVPAAVFARKAVGGELNCAACHGDAENGRFAPQGIAIPKERNTP